ncbi:GntR family transcriptional regulator [Streptomyces sp. CA2R106]|uniref:GntR family transcriptional regulator n=1 Tax=Streptomyces sp. CA2R106 TaxID=3120153 RepID=UPI0030099E87
MPDQSSPRGTFLAIAGQLREQIMNNELPDRLPSHAAIVQEYGVSRGVAIRALDVLKDEGLIASVPGGRWRVVRDRERDDVRPLTERITALIVEKGLQIGDSVPSTAALCELFDVSRPTVRRALDKLEAQGLLSAGSQGKVRTALALPGQEGTAKP